MQLKENETITRLHRTLETWNSWSQIIRWGQSSDMSICHGKRCKGARQAGPFFFYANFHISYNISLNLQKTCYNTKFVNDYKVMS